VSFVVVINCLIREVSDFSESEEKIKFSQMCQLDCYKNSNLGKLCGLLKIAAFTVLSHG
jgi:hypothetical protein